MYKNEELLKSLKKEQTELLKKIESKRIGEDYGTYKNLINALKEVVCLIQREEDRQPLEKPMEWKLQYSNYKTGDNIPMVSVWEQNTNGEIRNTKQFRLYDDKLLKIIVGLSNQISTSDFEDISGMRLKNNTYYMDLINYLDLQNIKEKMNISISDAGVTVHNGKLIIKNDEVKDLYFDVDILDNNKFKGKVYIEGNINYMLGSSIEEISWYIISIIKQLECKVNIYGDTRGFGQSIADQLESKGYVVCETNMKGVNTSKN